MYVDVHGGSRRQQWDGKRGSMATATREGRSAGGRRQKPNATIDRRVPWAPWVRPPRSCGRHRRRRVSYACRQHERRWRRRWRSSPSRAREGRRALDTTDGSPHFQGAFCDLQTRPTEGAGSCGFRRIVFGSARVFAAASLLSATTPETRATARATLPTAPLVLPLAPLLIPRASRLAMATTQGAFARAVTLRAPRRVRRLTADSTASR